MNNTLLPFLSVVVLSACGQLIVDRTPQKQAPSTEQQGTVPDAGPGNPEEAAALPPGVHWEAATRVLTLRGLTDHANDESVKLVTINGVPMISATINYKEAYKGVKAIFTSLETKAFRVSDVTGIRFIGGSGSDQMVNETLLPAEAWGMAGDDWMRTQAVTDIFHGGAGMDRWAGAVKGILDDSDQTPTPVPPFPLDAVRIADSELTITVTGDAGWGVTLVDKVENGVRKTDFWVLYPNDLGQDIKSPLFSVESSQLTHCTFIGGPGQDVFLASSSIPCDAYGNGGSDLLELGSGGDLGIDVHGNRLFGGPGGDTIRSSGHDNYLDGGPDVDFIYAKPTDTALVGDTGRNYLFIRP